MYADVGKLFFYKLRAKRMWNDVQVSVLSLLPRLTYDASRVYCSSSRYVPARLQKLTVKVMASRTYLSS